MAMNQYDISNLRAINQQLTSGRFRTAKEVAEWMGALQAQDYNMSKWALGIRLQGSTISDIEKEIDSGSIVRTHLLRPTWHFVSAADICWLLALTGPRIKSAMKGRDKQLELNDNIYSKCNNILERSLRDANHKTREELTGELRGKGVRVDGNRASHIFMRAELEGLICSGRQKNGKPTYTLLEEWVSDRRRLSRDEALAELARRYFTSHGPATAADFNWWSGLSATETRLALGLSRSLLVSEVINQETYWLTESSMEVKPGNSDILLLPAFDEFLISYRDRTASLSFADNRKAVSNNGIFYPTLLHNGQIVGTWKRTLKNKKVTLSHSLFKNISPLNDRLLKNGLTRYSEYIGSTITGFP